MRETMKLFALVVGTCLWATIATARERGPERDNSDDQVASFMGIRTDPSDPEFVRRFKEASFASKRMKLLESLQPIDLIYFLMEDDLKDNRTEALNVYSLNYGKLRLFLNDKDLAADPTAFQNEIVFKEVDTFKQLVTPIATKAKSLALNFTSLTYKDDKKIQLADAFKKIEETKITSSIEQLELHGVFGNEYDGLDKIRFEKVQELFLNESFLYYYSYENPNAGDKNMKLKDIISYDPKKSFPNVVRLAITRTEFSDFNWIKTHYTKLTHLMVDSSSENYFNDKEILDALKANTGLTTFGVLGCSLDLLLEIGKAGNFANIKILGLKQVSSKFESMRGDINVNDIERFYFEEEKPQRISRIFKFNKLQELYWRSPDAGSKLMRILRDHKSQIKKLTIDQAIVKDADLTEIEGMEVLEEVTFVFDPSKPIAMTPAALLKFIREQDKKKLTLVRLVTKDIKFLSDVNTAMQVPQWSEFFNTPPDQDKAIYTKNSKIPDLASADKFIFFKNYF